MHHDYVSDAPIFYSDHPAANDLTFSIWYLMFGSSGTDIIIEFWLNLLILFVWSTHYNTQWSQPRSLFNTLRPRQHIHQLANYIFQYIFLNEVLSIAIKISLSCVPKVPVNNIPALVQIKAWRWPGDKPLSEPMVLRLLTHICVTWSQWVKWKKNFFCQFQTICPSKMCYQKLSKKKR